jgi:hypothetical protein
MSWKTKKYKNIAQGKNIILIEGLPGMGNVGKIAVDFIIDDLKAEKVLEITSDNFPHCVFVNDKNLIELPSIDLYQKTLKGNTLMFLAGDIQPLTEKGCYEFCELLLDLFKKNKGKEIITLGGIGLSKIPENPKLYYTGNSKAIIKKYTSKKLSNKIHGVVGPILGVTGLLLGIAEQKKIPAIAILAETYGHPNYLGIKGAREIIGLLNESLGLKVNINRLNTEIQEIEKEIKTKTQSLTKIMKKKSKKSPEDLDYIG